MGGKTGGQIVPGDTGGDFVDDGFEDEAIVEGRSAAQEGRRRGKEGLEDGPLFVGRDRVLGFHIINRQIFIRYG